MGGPLLARAESTRKDCLPGHSQLIKNHHTTFRYILRRYPFCSIVVPCLSLWMCRYWAMPHLRIVSQQPDEGGADAMRKFGNQGR